MVFLAPNGSTDDARHAEFDLETWPFYWIVGTSALYVEALQEELSKGKLDVTIWRVLMIMPVHGSLDVGTLAKKTVTKRPTMSRILNRMEESGYIVVNPIDSDKRVRKVELTAKGRRTKKKAKLHADNISKSALKNLSRAELTTMMNILSKMQRNL